MSARHTAMLAHAIDLFHRRLILDYIRAKKGERTAAMRRMRAYVLETMRAA